MELRISLLRHLNKAVEVLGGAAVEVVENSVCPGEAKCSLLLDLCKISQEWQDVESGDKQVFIGEHPSNIKIAEHRAVMAVKTFLEDGCCLQFHDHSADKIKVYEDKIDKLISRVKAISSRLHAFIKQFQLSISLISSLDSSLSVKESSLITAVLKNLCELCMKPQADIDRLKDECLSLDAHFSQYTISSSTAHKDVKAVCVFGGTEFLSDVLGILDLPQAEFSVHLHENDVFKGTCSISMSCLNPSTSSIRVNIEGDFKASPIEAQESAAVQALIYLERAKDFDLVDFNYDSLMVLRKKHDQLLKLRFYFMSVVSDVSKSWDDFVSSLDSMLCQQYGRLDDVFWDAEHDGDYEDLVAFCRGVQDAVDEICTMQHKARSEVSVMD